MFSNAVAVINRMLRPVGVRLQRINRKMVSVEALDHAACFRRLIAQGMQAKTIVDVGASDGKWAQLCRAYFPDATIVAFEPLEEQMDALRAMAKGDGNMFVVNAAAGSENDVVSFNVAGNLDGSGIYGSEDGSRVVPVRRIDDEMASRGLKGPYFIKLDTHGYELPILEGAQNTLRETTGAIIEAYMFRITDSSPLFHELCDKMASYGFRCCDLLAPLRRPGDEAMWQCDLVFQPKGAKVFQSERYESQTS